MAKGFDASPCRPQDLGNSRFIDAMVLLESGDYIRVTALKTPMLLPVVNPNILIEPRDVG